MDIMNNLNEKEGGIFKHRILFFISLLNVLIVVIAVFFVVSMGSILQGDKTQRPQLNVNGEGKIFVRPDIAMFTATVVSDSARVGDAQNQNTSHSNAIIDFLKKNNIQEKDIKTTNYSIQPQYRYDNRPPCLIISNKSIPCSPGTSLPPRIVSYQVHHSLEIRMRDLSKVDDILQGVVSAGANQVGSILFAVEDEKATMAKARKQAIDDAQAKALILARDLDVRITKITGFSESGGAPIYYSRGLEAQSFDKGGAPAPQIEPGEQEIRSNVTITYEFK